MAVVTLASEGGPDKGGASPQIASTVACRKDAQLEPQRAVSEEGLPCIEDLHDKDRGAENVDNERAKREDPHTSVTGDSAGCAEAIQSFLHARTLTSQRQSQTKKTYLVCQIRYKRPNK